MKAPDELIEQIQRQEGLRLQAYQDTLGNWTIGYGHTPAMQNQVITNADAEKLLISDLREAESDLIAALPWTQTLDIVRYCVLWNMTFNMGIHHLLEFKEMLDAVRHQDWQEASSQMLNSLWAEQDKDRATELAEQMRTDSWFNPEV